MKSLPPHQRAAALCLAAVVTLAHHAAIHALAQPGAGPPSPALAGTSTDCDLDPAARQC